MKDSSDAVWLQFQGNPQRFADTAEAQAFLDTVPYKSEVEWVQAPQLFRLVNDVGAPLANWRKIINQVDIDFERAVSADETIFRRPESFEYRGVLLAVFKSVMDIVESRLTGEDREKFREARDRHYKALVYQESVVNDNICIETMYQVTTREITAGRMPADSSTRKIVELGIAAPHLTRDELLAGAADAASPTVGTPNVSESSGIWQRAIAYVRRCFSTAEKRERRKSLGHD